jgi:PHD/YefM family antitoxin component YafN of YafNO toxin-antitoxin module
MKRLPVQDAQANLAALIDTVRYEPIALTRRGKVRAAIVAMDESDFEAYSLVQNPKFVELIERSRARARREGTVLLEKLARDLKLPPRRKS